jgi:hypothetical protein
MVTAIYSQSSWLLTGNSLTADNFLGSKSNYNFPLSFMSGDSLAGFTGYEENNSNVSFGWQALAYTDPVSKNRGNTAFGVQAQSGKIVNGDALAIGIENTSIGNFALKESSGNYSVAIGMKASEYNTKASSTVAIGTHSLSSNYSDSVRGADGGTAIGYATAVFGYKPVLIKKEDGFVLDLAAFPGTIITATGYAALHENTGHGNTAHGYSALQDNTTGNLNVAIGSEALHLNTTGGENTAIGWKALLNNTTGGDNTAVGAETLVNTTTGAWNVAMGYNTLKNNTEGFDNTAFGSLSLLSNTIGGENVAIGKEALANNVEHAMNTAIGYQALFKNKEGNNIAAGYQALYNNTDGGDNTALGVSALLNTTEGSRNTAFGLESLRGNIRGNYNTAIGYRADVASGILNNTTTIGHGARATACNQVTIGNTAVTSIKANVTWAVLSDSQTKKNIRQNVPGLAFIKKLQPVTYTIDPDAVDNLLGVDEEEKNTFSEDEIAARNSREQEVQTGFIAQDVEKAAESLGFDFSAVDNMDSNAYGLRYSEFVVPLVKAVQELSAQNENKNAAIASLQKQIEELETLKNLLLANKKGINK